MKRTKVLTSPGIAKMKHSGGPHSDEVPDGSVPGLYAVIYPSGKKSGALRYRRPDGRTAKIVLGTFNPARDHKGDPDPIIGGYLTWAAMRRLAGTLRHQILTGKDPAALHRAEKEAVALSAADTFGGAAKDFVTQYAKKNIRHWRVQAKMLGFTEDESGGLALIEKGLAARWRDKPLAEIDGDALFRVIDEARYKGVAGLALKNAEASEARARSMHAVLSTMFGWLLGEKRRIKVNPMVGLKRPAKPKARERSLDDKEIIAFLRAADDEGSSPFRPMLWLLLLTGCRLREVAEMEAKELSDDCATWTIPSRRSKNKLTHVVPLPPLARQLIAGIERLPECPFVFSTNQRTPVSGFSKLKRRLDRIGMPGAPPWVLHDVRRTVVTHMCERGVPPHVVELCVNHVSGVKAGVAGTYNRSELMSERRAALEFWAHNIEHLINHGKWDDRMFEQWKTDRVRASRR